MSLYNEAIELLKRDNYVSEFYRFQGGKSFEYFNIKTSKFDVKPNNSYTYFSSSIDHHKYFSVKRIRQLLNKTVLQDTPYSICKNDLSNIEIFRMIIKLIENSKNLSDLYSLKLITDANYFWLIKDNYFMQENKNCKKTIERVDRRVYGGGYGVAAEWKDLLNCLTYFTAFRRIDRDSMIELLCNMKNTGKINQKDNISKIISDKKMYTVDTTEALESDFTKYKIIDLMETIIEKGILLPEGELNKHPTKTIKKVVTDYEKGKSKVLQILNNHKAIK